MSNIKDKRTDDLIIVEGNNTLCGDIKISGAKNSVLKLMAASILANDVCIIKNVPNISDIDIMSKVLKELGARIKRAEHSIEIDTSQISNVKASYNLVSKMRATIAVLGPLIARFGRACVAMPGGCQIGARKIDMHLFNLHKMGVEFEMNYGYINAKTPKGLHGKNIFFDFPSVGATENVLMAAVCAKGKTIIDNASREPEIGDLCRFLNKLGCNIKGIGTSCLEIWGVSPDSLHGTTHTTIGDRIEAGTFLIGGALTGGPVTVSGIDPDYLKIAIRKLKAIGIKVNTGSDSITVSRDKNLPLKNIEIQTLPFPGFPTDLQAQFMLLLCLANGTSIVTENVFENRFMFASEIVRMGAKIHLDHHHAIINGPTQLQGVPVSSTDLRAGASLVLAGIIAQGTTYVSNVGHIDRGYEFFCEKLKYLGANVRRVHKDDI